MSQQEYGEIVAAEPQTRHRKASVSDKRLHSFGNIIAAAKSTESKLQARLARIAAFIHEAEECEKNGKLDADAALELSLEAHSFADGLRSEGSVFSKEVDLWDEIDLAPPAADAAVPNEEPATGC